MTLKYGQGLLKIINKSAKEPDFSSLTGYFKQLQLFDWITKAEYQSERLEIRVLLKFVNILGENLS